MFLQAIVHRDFVQFSQPSAFQTAMTCYTSLREFEYHVGFTDTGSGTGMFNNSLTESWLNGRAKQLYVQASAVCDGAP
jgi:hypothetical protein